MSGTPPSASASLFNPAFTFGTASSTAAENKRAIDPAQQKKRLAQDIASVRDKTGICAEHLLKLHDIAKTNECVIAFRPVDPHNAQLIEAGHPTKGLEIKGKSSTVGPLYGLIPADQALSGKGATTPEQIRDANAAIASIIEKDLVAKAPLELSRERFDYLIEHGLVQITPSPPDNIAMTSSTNPPVAFTAMKTSEGNYQILHEGKPVEALMPSTMKESSSPQKFFTADYDLLFVMPKWKDAPEQGRRRSSIKPPGLDEQPTRLGALGALGQGARAGLRQGSVAEAPLGNADFSTTLEQRIRNEINGSLRGDLLKAHSTHQPEHWNLVHHGSDEGNPNSDMASNLPATVIAPGSMGEFGSVSVQDFPEDLQSLVDQARISGYMLHGNRSWSGAGLTTRVQKLSMDYERRMSSASSTSSPSISRRGSQFSDAEVAGLNAAAARRGSVPHLASIRRSSLAPTDPSIAEANKHS